MSRIGVSNITSDGRITIPEEIRKLYQLQTGEQLEWTVTDSGTLEIRPVGRSLDDLVKILPRPERTLTVEQLDDAIAEHLAEKHRVRR
jgi:antitoxin PrlF